MPASILHYSLKELRSMARDLAQYKPKLLIKFQKIAVRVRPRRTLARLRQAGRLTNFDNIGADAHCCNKVEMSRSVQS
jgi:hypothetical protein